MVTVGNRLHLRIHSLIYIIQTFGVDDGALYGHLCFVNAESAIEPAALHYIDMAKTVKLTVSALNSKAQLMLVLRNRNLLIDGMVPVLCK